ncbi:hypothetical protein G4V39_02405 [Thermosulfuriphilus ammonigenes]|uniref:Uncharacterized protein n=1 Tax=Thermosulfuriphilus ammonigenes TaxID=1936021 RepID=A0A6G7PUD4_9BACT|nr:hypothetical protein [Thermosulfuriphilus ammonigenes]MBA2848665.1 hypothetical protein [Thermosulfuriphilus ammonigenes]QIJ71197.1 hypothetical protein G4V39_02405 [Thermosulfuriphilus ammonigenes]
MPAFFASKYGSMVSKKKLGPGKLKTNLIALMLRASKLELQVHQGIEMPGEA